VEAIMSELDNTKEQLDMDTPMEPEEWKSWLFKENIRLSAKEKELNLMREQFDKEKEQFCVEMKSWSKQIRFEKARLEQESSFFDKKFKLLENGFKQLAADKEQFVAEKRAYESRQKFYKQSGKASSGSAAGNPSESFFFKGVHNQLGLKKRYKDLIKIFHPDNICGDTETVSQINKEYEILKEYFDKR
jgi:hypothetical protein